MKHRNWNATLGFAVALAAFLVLGMPAHALGTSAGTDITNQATVTYEDANGNPLTATSNVVTTTVSQVAGVVVDPDNSGSGNPGDTIVYAHTLTNNGNEDDTFDLTASSAGGWTTVVFLDDNGNGQYDAGTDTVIADSGLVLENATFDFWVAVTIPAGTADGASDVTTVTATSQFDANVSDTATDTTNVTSPELTVSKSVSPTGPQPPGTTLTYTIVVTNGGSAAASGVVLTDPVPANTTYVDGSITQDGDGRSDAADTDNADHDVTNPGQVTVNIGTLASSGSTTVEFQVTID
jgi:uncharacterized repeat protein (TIGR01451 family)